MKKEGDPMKAPKSFYVCSECDYRSAKWMGKCPGCGAWNTMQEQQEAAGPDRDTTGPVK